MKQGSDPVIRQWCALDSPVSVAVGCTTALQSFEHHSHTVASELAPGLRLNSGCQAVRRQLYSHSPTEYCTAPLPLQDLSFLATDITFYVASNRNTNWKYLRAEEVKNRAP